MRSLGRRSHGSRKRKRDLDLLWESGREHHGSSLSHGRHGVLLHDPPDLGLKPHVQHSVCLIQHQVSEGGGRERDLEQWVYTCRQRLTGRGRVQLSLSPARPPVSQEWPPASDSPSPGPVAEPQCLPLRTPHRVAPESGRRTCEPRSRSGRPALEWGPG